MTRGSVPGPRPRLHLQTNYRLMQWCYTLAIYRVLHHLLQPPYQHQFCSQCYTNVDWCRGQHWKIMPWSCAMLPDGSTATLHDWRSSCFQCWSRLTVNMYFVISRNKYNKFASSSMTQQHRIRIDPPNISVRPKNWYKCMVQRSLHHVPREHGSRVPCSPGAWRCADETGQHCLFLPITWHTLDQSQSRNSDRDTL